MYVCGVVQTKRQARARARGVCAILAQHGSGSGGGGATGKSARGAVVDTHTHNTRRRPPPSWDLWLRFRSAAPSSFLVRLRAKKAYRVSVDGAAQKAARACARTTRRVAASQCCDFGVKCARGPNASSKVLSGEGKKTACGVCVVGCWRVRTVQVRVFMCVCVCVLCGVCVRACARVCVSQRIISLKLRFQLSVEEGWSRSAAQCPK